MQESRPLAGSTLDIVWLRRSRLLNSCLLVVGLALGVVAGTSVGMQLDGGGLALSMSQAVLLLIGAAWLAVAYVFSRRRRFQLAGGMVIALVAGGVALAVYLLPAYTLPLLPFGCLPIALAALLLSWRAVYTTAVATILALAGASALAQQPHAPGLGLALPAPDAPLSFAIAAVALFLLALILAPLRGEVSSLFNELQHNETSHTQIEQRRREAEHTREQALGLLAWQRNHTNLILESIGDGVIAVDAGGRVVHANPSARSLWADIGAGELLDRPFDQVREALTGQSLATPHAAIAEIAEKTLDDGSSTYILHDRREQQRLMRLRGELLGLLADEMRNPLTSMVTALEMTLGQNLPDGADRVLAGARRSGQRLLNLITTMLEIYQIEQNPGVLRREATPLRPVLEAGIAQTAPLAQQAAVTVVVEYSGDGPILLDGDRIRRAFVYLLENALHESPPYSTVQIRIERQTDLILVRISDQGPGLTAQQREVLFDQRAAPLDHSAPALGLAFSKLVIETHGGRVWVESTGSQGSTYTFSLPIETSSDPI